MRIYWNKQIVDAFFRRVYMPEIRKIEKQTGKMVIDKDLRQTRWMDMLFELRDKELITSVQVMEYKIRKLVC